MRQGKRGEEKEQERDNAMGRKTRVQQKKLTQMNIKQTPTHRCARRQLDKDKTKDAHAGTLAETQRQLRSMTSSGGSGRLQKLVRPGIRKLSMASIRVTERACKCTALAQQANGTPLRISRCSVSIVAYV